MTNRNMARSAGMRDIIQAIKRKIVRQFNQKIQVSIAKVSLWLYLTNLVNPTHLYSLFSFCCSFHLSSLRFYPIACKNLPVNKANQVFLMPSRQIVRAFTFNQSCVLYAQLLISFSFLCVCPQIRLNLHAREEKPLMPFPLILFLRCLPLKASSG